MTTPATDARFKHQTYMIRRKFFKVFGASFQVYDPNGQVVFHSRQKAFKLKEDIRIYGDEDGREELLTIAARSWLDFGAGYDVVDATRGEKVGALRRHGLRSMLRDQWSFLDPDDREIGLIREDNQLMATVRRFVPYGDFVPQKFVGTLGERVVCEFSQHFNPIIQKITLDFSPDTDGLLDRRLGLAAGILLSAIEERQD